MMFTCHFLPISNRWEVVRNDGMIMFVGSRGRAEYYCQRKNAEMVR